MRANKEIKQLQTGYKKVQKKNQRENNERTRKQKCQSKYRGQIVGEIVRVSSDKKYREIVVREKW